MNRAVTRLTLGVLLVLLGHSPLFGQLSIAGGGQHQTVGAIYGQSLTITRVCNETCDSTLRITVESGDATLRVAGMKCQGGSCPFVPTLASVPVGSLTTATNVQVKAGTTAGPVKITVSDNTFQFVPASAILTNDADAASSVAVVSGNNQTIHTAAAYAPLQVRVADQYNNPRSADVVTFSVVMGATGAGASFAGASSTVVNTNTSGIATTSAPLTANATTGNFSVQATVSGLAATFSMANTAVPIAVTVNTAPSGLAVSVDNVPCTAPCNLNWTVGELHSISTTSTQPGGAQTRYRFNKWSDNGTLSHTVTATASTTNYLATFDTQFLLVTTANPSGVGTVQATPASSDGSGYYASGAQVSLNAQAAAGYQFGSWSADLSGTSNPAIATMGGPRNVTANFTRTNSSKLNLTFLSFWTRDSSGAYIYTARVTVTNPSSQILQFPSPIQIGYTSIPAGGTLQCTGCNLSTSMFQGVSFIPNQPQGVEFSFSFPPIGQPPPPPDNPHVTPSEDFSSPTPDPVAPPFPSNCPQFVLPAEIDVPANGLDQSFAVIPVGSACGWYVSASPTQGFVNVAPAANIPQAGEQQLHLNLGANSGLERRAMLTLSTDGIAQQVVTIVQAQAPTAGQCIFPFTPSTISLNAQGGFQTIPVSFSSATCSFNPRLSSWLTLQAQTATSFSFNYGANPSSSDRTGTITVDATATQILTVTQPGRACQFNVTTSGALPAAGVQGSLPFTVDPADCRWNASSDSSWMRVSTLSGTGSGTLTYQADANTTGSKRVAILTLGNRTVSLEQAATGGGGFSTAGLRFVSLTPCRVMETRTLYNSEGRTGVFGPPSLNAGEVRTLDVPSSNVCQIPAVAKAYVFNVTLVPHGGVDFITVWPAGDVRPAYWTVRSPDGNIVANSAIVRAGVNGGISVYSSNSTDLLIDIAGYFTDNANVSNLVYYPLTPCRVTDTRILYRASGTFGAPFMNARETRNFRLPASPYCQIPAGAAAYSMTITVSPPGPLQYLTAWPAGGAQPNVSSVNSPAGRILANSVIVPASSDGTVEVYTYDRSDVLIDVNGYFAPDDFRNGLLYYPITQCRAVDSTNAAYSGTFGAAFGDDTTHSIAVPASPFCSSIPATARAYALNVTAIPNGVPMAYLTAFPTGAAKPNASLLNAFAGQTVSSAGIIPAGTNGSIDVYTSGRTQIAIEISGYFGR